MNPVINSVGLQRWGGLQEHSRRSRNPGAGRAQVRGGEGGSCAGASELSRVVPCHALLLVLFPRNSRALGCCSSSWRHLFSWVGGREGWDPLQALPNVSPCSRLRFRCSCAAPEAAQLRILIQMDLMDPGSPLGGDGRAGLRSWSRWIQWNWGHLWVGWESLRVTAAPRGSGAVPESLCCIPSVFWLGWAQCSLSSFVSSPIPLSPHLLRDHLGCSWFFIPFWILSCPTPNPLYFPSTQTVARALILPLFLIPVLIFWSLWLVFVFFFPQAADTKHSEILFLFSFPLCSFLPLNQWISPQSWAWEAERSFLDPFPCFFLCSDSCRRVFCKCLPWVTTLENCKGWELWGLKSLQLFQLNPKILECSVKEFYF